MEEKFNLEIPETGERLLERHLQHFLAANLNALFKNSSLRLIGTEFATPAGRVDVLAVERDRFLWVIETKYGVASRDAVSQVQSYMEAVKEIEGFREMEVRGFLVAESFDSQCEYALRAAREVTKVYYKVGFELSMSPDSDALDSRYGENGDDTWVVDLEKGIFYPKQKPSRAFSVHDRISVRTVLGEGYVELRAKQFSIGKYRKVEE